MTATDTIQKRKRGRPPVLEPALRAGLNKYFGERVHTDRGILNKYYEIQGMKAVQELKKEGIEGLDYLVDDMAEKMRSGILRELGKLSLDRAKECAIAVCEASKTQKRTVQEWGNILRAYRLHPERFSETVSDNQEDIE